VSGDAPEPYRVSYSQRQQHQLRAMADQAAAAGLFHRYVAALDHINQCLGEDPVGFGDQNYTLRGMGLPVFLRIYSVLRFTYAVAVERRIVYIRSIHLFLPKSVS
jgi:hypothetical protein